MMGCSFFVEILGFEYFATLLKLLTVCLETEKKTIFIHSRFFFRQEKIKASEIKSKYKKNGDFAKRESEELHQNTSEK